MKKSALRVVGYARVSTDTQTDNTSIEFQVEKITEYCKLYDFELAKVFIDNGRTGSSVDAREAYQEMIEFGIYSYDGKIEKNGIKNKGQVPVIISKQLWNRVQKRTLAMCECR